MRVVPLAVSGAFHTPLMGPAAERLHAALQRVAFRTARIPVVSNVDAQPHTHPDDFRRLLGEQIIAPVRWEASIQGLLRHGVDRFYEVGPGRVLRGLLKRIDRKAVCESIEV